MAVAAKMLPDPDEEKAELDTAGLGGKACVGVGWSTTFEVVRERERERLRLRRGDLDLERRLRELRSRSRSLELL